MSEILDTTPINHLNGTFLIDLIKDQKGILSVDIKQTGFNDSQPVQNLSIPADQLTDIIKTLQTYHAIIGVTRKIETKHITKNIQQKIQDYYFKGVDIDDIANLLGQSKALILAELKKMDVEIVSNKPPKPFYRRRKK